MTQTIRDHEYTREHANRAVRRHERRPVEARMRLLLALISSAAYDGAPTFEGIDPSTGPFRGPSVREWLADVVGYMLAAHLPTSEIVALVRNGAERYHEHERMMRASYAART